MILMKLCDCRVKGKSLKSVSQKPPLNGLVLLASLGLVI